MFQEYEKQKVTHETGWSVDKGLTRENNEDCVMAVDLGYMKGQVFRSISIYVLADGMGGVENGDIASRIAAQTAIDYLQEQISQKGYMFPDEYEQCLASAVEEANRAVYAEESEMGTTLVLALVVDDEAYIASVGDSRAYHLTQDDIIQITEDQSVVQMLLNAGAISNVHASKHPLRNVLSQAVGTQSLVDVDTYTFNAAPNDYLLLCSDGLTKEIDDDSITNIIQQSASPQEACDALVVAANDAGGHDNISVVLIQWK